MTYRLLVLFGLLGITGCLFTSKVDPLSLRYYRRNLVLDKDNVLKIESYSESGVQLEEVPLDNFRKHLVGRQITTATSITLHVHRYAAPSAFDQICELLKSEGYRNLEFIRFRDPKPHEMDRALKRRASLAKP